LYSQLPGLKPGNTKQALQVFSKHLGVKKNMKTFIRVMKALSDSNRVKMMKMLQNRPLCVCEIKEALGVAQSTASKHLKILEDAGLVRSFKDGLWVNYSLADGSDSPFASNMIGNMKHWLEDESEIKNLNEILPGINRNEIVGKRQAARRNKIIYR